MVNPAPIVDELSRSKAITRPPFSDEGLLTRDRMLPKQGKEERKIGWQIEGGIRRPHLHIYALFPLGEESDL